MGNQLLNPEYEIRKADLVKLRTKINVKNSDMTDNIFRIQPKTTLDERTFEQSFMAHFDGLFRYCMTIVKDQADAEDIVQGVFTDLWQDRHKMNIHTSIQAFLYKAVYFKCMNRIKKEKVAQKYIATLPVENHNTCTSNPAIFLEINEKINEGIDALPDQCRRIFTLSRYDGLRYQEIADHLQLSIKTIENQMGKALKTLRIHLADYLHLLIINLLTFF